MKKTVVSFLTLLESSRRLSVVETEWEELKWERSEHSACKLWVFWVLGF